MGDVIARYKRAKGFNVLHPMGWDAFGMPAENAAMEKKVHPKDWTCDNIADDEGAAQVDGPVARLEPRTGDLRPAYYRHEQAMFLDFLEGGPRLAQGSKVNWDPVDHTVLANEQVIEGGLAFGRSSRAA